MSGSTNTIFAGVPIGSSSLLPEAKYVPQVAITNFSARALRVRIQYAQTTGDSPAVENAKDLTLPASSTTQLNLDNLHGGAGLQNSFVINSAATPRHLTTNLASTSQPPLHALALLPNHQ